MCIKKMIGWIFILVLLTGCAVGNKYNYRVAEISLPLKGSEEVSLSVIDKRLYVLSGSKASNFIGLQRGGYGNPFNVTTLSGAPLSDDMFFSIQNALEKNGFIVSSSHFSSPNSTTILTLNKSHGFNKSIVLTINEWKTDAVMKLRLIYNLQLNVIDSDGAIIASNSLQGDDVIGGAGFEAQNSASAVSAFEMKLRRLFNSSDIINALATN